jgi:itaconate CoA-transferase
MRHQYLSPYGPFRTADGKYVSVVVASEVDWQRFCDALQRADWASDPAFATVADRSQRRRQLDAMVEEVIGEAPLEHWAERLAQAGLAHGTVRTIAEVVDHPQLIDRGVFVEGDSPVGPLRQIRFPLSEPTRLDVPGLGEHTDEVLAELGYSAADISELRASRVI